MKKGILFIVAILFAFTTKAQWEQVGEQNFSFHEIKDHAIAVDSEGTPYVLYITTDNPSYKEIRVEKFNGTNWETVGEDNIMETNQFLVVCPYIEIDGNDNIYISYHFNDVANTEKFHTVVREFNGTNWEKIGDFTSLVSTWSHGSAFCLDNEGDPHVLYYAGGDAIAGATTIEKYTGTAWETISETTTASSWIYQPGMTIDSDNNIYIAYADHADDSKRLRVDKFNGTSWENIGNAISVHGAIDQMSSSPQQIIVDNNGFIHVAAITDPYYGGGSPDYVFERYYFDGTEWVGGIVQESNGMSVSLNTDNQGGAYCAYRIIDGTSQAFVQKFINQEWVAIGEQPVVDDFTLIYIAIDNTGTPYILYKDYYNDERKLSVKKYLTNGQSAENDILSFQVLDQIGETVINTEEHTVIVDVPFGTNVTALSPEITISQNAIINPESGVSQDFTEDFVYTVVAENGDEQEWTITIDVLTGIYSNQNHNFSIYPNPTNGIFLVTLNNSFLIHKMIAYQLSISTITGKVIYTSVFSNLQTERQMNLSNQPKGIYFLKIQTKNHTFTEKLIIQ